MKLFAYIYFLFILILSKYFNQKLNIENIHNYFEKMCLFVVENNLEKFKCRYISVIYVDHCDVSTREIIYENHKNLFQYFLVRNDKESVVISIYF